MSALTDATVTPGTPLLVRTTTTNTNAADSNAWVARNQASVEDLLRAHGAVLFRGFPLACAEDFDAFVCGFAGWEDLSYEKSMSFAVRTRKANRIATTNEGKTGGLVFHHEQAQTPLYPSKIFFCCEQPAATGDGGQTGISSSVALLQQLRAAHPEFVAKCVDVGVKYTLYAGEVSDASKGAGRSWSSFFHVDTREECERVMAEGGWIWEWGVGASGESKPDNFLKATTPRLDAVKTAPGTEKECFFNQLIASTANAMEFVKVGVDDSAARAAGVGIDTPTQEALSACVRFADGEEIDLAVLLEAKAMAEKLAVDVQWETGDVLLLDNYLFMHARRIWSGPEGSRRLYASLVK